MRSDPIPVWPGEEDVHGGWGRSEDWSVPDKQQRLGERSTKGGARMPDRNFEGGGDGDGFVQRETNDANAS